MAAQVRVLSLSDGQVLDRCLYRFEKGWTLRFVPGPSLLGRRVRLFTNHPPDAQTAFVRAAFRELQWEGGEKRRADILCQLAGSFAYYFDFGDDNGRRGSGYFLVSPELSVAGELLPLDAVTCQTYLAKLLGPLPEWEGRLRVAAECGYNVVHLTPPQALGRSNSSYSLKSQLKLNPIFTTAADETLEDVKALVDRLEKEWGLLTISDVVWNHTASNSPWLQEHPECAYNLHNSAHLKPAFLLDHALCRLGAEVAAGKWQHRGVPAAFTDEQHVHALRLVLFELLDELRLVEFYVVHIDRVSAEFAALLDQVDSPICGDSAPPDLSIVQCPEMRRFGCTVNLTLAALRYNSPWPQCASVGERRRACLDAFGRRLAELNEAAVAVCRSHEQAAVDALSGHVRYERVAAHGPRYASVTATQPLFPEFARAGRRVRYFGVKAYMNSAKNVHLMAHNGWVISDDPLKNFAEAPSMVYLRRELICWGDSVKLRYGSKPADCPYLWQHMAEYARLSARVFHGVRLDNCHSTPIEAAEYLLDEARRVRPELYVVAELFTGGEDLDNVFVNRLGITSLIREAQSAGDAHEQGRLVFRYGGEPVGAFEQLAARPAVPTIAHALFVDQTHDNPCPVVTRTVFDPLPTAALVGMASCATGSSRGYDELVPFHINVVHERRLYQSMAEGVGGSGTVTLTDGIMAGRRAINRLHSSMATAGFKQVFVDQLTKDVVAVTRHNPVSHETVVLVARTCFGADRLAERVFALPPLVLNGSIVEAIFEMRLVPVSGEAACASEDRRLSDDSEFCVGLRDYRLEIKENLPVCACTLVEVNSLSAEQDALLQKTEIDLKHFPPGSVVAFRVAMSAEVKQSILGIRHDLVSFGFRPRSLSGKLLPAGPSSSGDSLLAVVDALSLADLQSVLFSCAAEESAEWPGCGAYAVPSFGALTYCGLQGLVPLMNKIRLQNDLGHPLCGNIRNGFWLADYVSGRLKRRQSTLKLGLWFEQAFAPLRFVPDFLRPRYFDAILCGSYGIIREALWAKMSPFVQSGGKLVRALALSTVSFCGYSSTAKLPPVADVVSPPTVLDEDGKRVQASVSIAAGLPHFSHGLFRNWGRDTFIALPGCLLVVGRHDEARTVILAYGGALRHGLIPNLLGEGVAARYNCRDAVWWWLYAVQLYCEYTGSAAILADPVRRLYAADDAIAAASVTEEPLSTTMQEALQRHFDGIAFRERNAGRAVDEHMTDSGFDVSAFVDKSTGFVRGGNEWNCGTWMDKMGSWERAGNRGRPATARDGAAVELQGLCASVVGWLAKCHADGSYPHAGVTDSYGKATDWSWNEWRQRLQSNFERCFFVGEADEQLDASANPQPQLINRRGIVKDSFGATAAFADYQLRPNFAVALTVAAELLPAERAKKVVEQAEQYLCGPLGVKTLDPSDWSYRGDYDNDNDSADLHTAKGFNYHQGPEWVWLMGYLLRAKLRAAHRLRQTDAQGWTEAVDGVQRRLATHWAHLHASPWASLPELTNSNGSACAHSCDAQAWSVGCILEVLHDLHRLTQD